MAFNKETQEVYDKAQTALAEARTFAGLMEGQEVGTDLYKEYQVKRDKAFASHDAVMDQYEARKKADEAQTRADSTLHAHRQAQHRPAADSHIQRDELSPYEVEDLDIRHTNLFNRYLQLRLNKKTGGETEAREFWREHRDSLVAINARYQKRDLGVASATAIGPNVVPIRMVEDINVRAAASGPMWDEGVTQRLNTEGGGDIDYPTVDDTANDMTYFAEAADRAAADTDPTFGRVTLQAHKYGSNVLTLTQELLEDNVVNLAALIPQLFGVRVGRGMNRILTSGDGPRTRGVVSQATATARTAANNAITADEILGAIHTVDPAYRSGDRVFSMFNDTTLRVLRGLRFGPTGDTRPIWTAGDIRSGAPSTIWGEAYRINQAVADIAANVIPFVYGNFNEFVVRVARGMDISFTDQLYWATDEVGFKVTVRAHGAALQSTAFSALLMKA